MWVSFEKKTWLQWLVQLSATQKVLPVTTQGICLLPQTKHVHIRLTGDSKVHRYKKIMCALEWSYDLSIVFLPLILWPQLNPKSTPVITGQAWAWGLGLVGIQNDALWINVIWKYIHNPFMKLIRAKFKIVGLRICWEIQNKYVSCVRKYHIF